MIEYLGPYVHAMGARKMSHCLPHAHRCCGRCAAKAASLVTTRAIVTECTSNNWANWPRLLCTLVSFASFTRLGQW